MYVIAKRDGTVKRYEQQTVGEPAITQFLIDLDEVESIIYYSIDKQGMKEKSHIIHIERSQEEKSFEGVPFEYDNCGFPPIGYSVYFTIDYFTIFDEVSKVVFVDKIHVNIIGIGLPAIQDPGIIVVGLRLDRNGEKIREKRGEMRSWTYWENIGAVDWKGKKNNYVLYAQLRSEWTFPCYKMLSKVGVPLILFPYGVITWEGYTSDRTFSVEFPEKSPLLKRIWERINPFQSKIHVIKIESGVVKASFRLSWSGSDLNLILYDPDGRKITPEVATIEPDIDFIEGVNYEQYTVINPAPGNWSVEIRAIDVPEEGLSLIHI